MFEAMKQWTWTFDILSLKLKTKDKLTETLEKLNWNKIVSWVALALPFGVYWMKHLYGFEDDVCDCLTKWNIVRIANI